MYRFSRATIFDTFSGTKSKLNDDAFITRRISTTRGDESDETKEEEEYSQVEVRSAFFEPIANNDARGSSL